MIVLGIESSCDDTSAAVVKDGRRVLSCVVTGQDSFHEKFGGVVPEIASRRHISVIDEIVRKAVMDSGVPLGDIEGVAATCGPGLIGAILVGLNYAKGLAYSLGVPLVGVNHVEAHLFAARLADIPPATPFVGLVVSGGHTNLYHVQAMDQIYLLGRTVDDAAGECFDKIGKLLGLDYPAGAQIDRLAADGDGAAICFPRPMIRSGDLNFSFSGLKTAVKNYIAKLDHTPEGRELCDIAAGFSAAVVDVLIAKLLVAAKQCKVGRIVIAGGVAANGLLRDRAAKSADEHGLDLFIPSLSFCTDNAAMIAASGTRALQSGESSPWSLNAFASLTKGK